MRATILRRYPFAYAVSAALGLALGGLSSGSAEATPCPSSSFIGIGQDTCGPEFLIEISSSGSASIVPQTYGGSDQGPYDGHDDRYIGVENNSNKVLLSLQLSAPVNIFGFDNDGIDTFPGVTKSPGNTDTTGYGGPIVSFSNITTNGSGATKYKGEVDFLNGLGAGQTTFFSLEDDATLSVDGLHLVKINLSSAPGPIPGAGLLSYLALGILGLGSMGWKRLRRQTIDTSV